MNNQPTPETKSFYVTAFDVEEWAEKCIRLEKERDEALSQIAQAECRAERFCQERDDARIDAQKSKAYKRVLKETNLRQTERIRYLEGATNHACGTPLSVALRERDEAREKAERYRLEANAIMMQRDEAREEANKLSGAYEDATNYYARIIQLKEEFDEAREALMKIEDLFIDGTDIYADRENMGLIARAALEEIK